MSGQDYYQELPDNSEQSLETDVMRFIAMIGIIFWLIFSITSAIPQSKVETKPEHSPAQISETTLDQPKIVKTETIKPETVKADPIKHEPIKPEIKTPPTQPIVPRPSAVPPKPKPAPEIQPTRKTEPQPQPQTKTLSIEFKTLDDLLTLLTKKSVTIFCQIKAPGFDLLFRNERLNRERLPIYTSTTNIPPILWEIKETKTRSFFLAALQKNFPATGNFPDRKVFVAFADAEFEQNIEKILHHLRAENRGGTIIINGTGELDFPSQ